MIHPHGRRIIRGTLWGQGTVKQASHLFDLLPDVLVDPVGGPGVVVVVGVGVVEAVAGRGGGGGAARVEPVQHHVHRRADELHVDDCGK